MTNFTPDPFDDFDRPRPLSAPAPEPVTFSPPPAQSPHEALEELAEYRAAVSLTRADYETKRAEILRAVQAELDALAAEYEPLFAVSAEREAALTETVKAAVISAGQTIKAGGLQAVYVRGRESWDTHALRGYAAAGHHEILAFQTVGQPSISIRVAK